MLSFSKYNYVLKLDDSNYIIFNTFTGSIILLDKSNYSKLLNADSTSKYTNDFLKQGFLIEENLEEKNIIDLDRIKSLCSSDVMTFRILTTTSCNARCFYCYEEGIKPCKMSFETAKNTCKFIIDKAKIAKKIIIQWFGGEPLMNQKIIDYITTVLINYCEKNNIDIKFTMVTNGYLFNKEIVKIAKDKWHIDKVQISLDGTKDQYFQRKRYCNNDYEAFDKVLNNIELLLKSKIKVSIRLNYDVNNYDDVINLIKILRNRFSAYDNFSCYPYPLFGTYCGHKHNTKNVSTPKMLMKIIKELIKNKIYNNETLLNFLKVRHGQCFACNINSFVINSDGLLYKCTADMSKNVGNVIKGVNLNKNFFQWCSTSINKKCKKCKFLPLCQGGCRAGYLNKCPVTCFLQKNIIDDILKTYVESKINQVDYKL